jgi:hypothetical protein
MRPLSALRRSAGLIVDVLINSISLVSNDYLQVCGEGLWHDIDLA